MTEFLNFFTDYDDSISGESFRDPIGLQVIWSALGQEIFGRQITSIANDLRNFTQALFQHYVTRDIVLDSSVEIPNFARDFYGSKNDAVFKKSLIIFLENLFIYTAVLEKMDTSGLLGSQSAGHKLKTFGGSPILAIHENAGILVRQISLGVNGRYKTPLMNLGLLDGQYEYTGEPASWNEVEDSFKGWPEAIELKELLKKILIERLENGRTKGISSKDIEPYRELSGEAVTSSVVFRYEDIAVYHEDLKRLYSAVLESQEGSRKHFGTFWKKRLGLNQGAAKAIFDALSSMETGYDVTNEDLLRRAAETTGLASDQKKLIDNIFSTEPLIAFFSNLFSFICSRENSDLEQIKTHIDQSKVGETGLQDIWNSIRWQEVQSIATNLRANFGTAGERLSKLARHMDWNLENCIRKIIAYHKELMEWRGLFPWVSIDDKGKIRHTGRSYTISNWEYRNWVHDYYLWSLKNLHKGFSGGDK